MLEAFYDKTCLAKCSGNCLEMNFEYSHVSVAQKLTELQILAVRDTLGSICSLRQFGENGDTL